ncbi:hypothetical protein B6V72_11250 [Thioclava sp. F34-6]|uniref:hypothetical protein n=1 Tax=Thioclava sp. F34-6 TaxID=1973003 RepID=UPI000B543867|nr:hypothetical protein [Thioclava sp. F34-6]OWY12471.1 hypothetical protein B6V72_11250 [Thioclava sp. F34-6]
MARLWNIAFGPRPSPWNLPAYLIWAIFGNVEDGPYGWLPRDASKPDPNWSATWAWWTRNPLHNLTHRTLAVPFKRQRVLIGRVSNPPAFWPDGHVLLAINGLPFFAVQFTRWEAYAGFRPKVVDDRLVGVFGLALRGRR